MTFIRILADQWRSKTLREHYWAAAATAARAGRLISAPNRAFRRVVFGDLYRFVLRRVTPVPDQTGARVHAAADWLMRAQDATPDGGVSYGYFPCDGDAGWQASYPETTGYIIPTMLQFARMAQSDDARSRALRMARWEVEVQMPSGAVQGGRLCEPARQTPASFNTGMVLHGWAEALREQEDEAVLEAARRAADFLLADMTEAGHFRTVGAFVVDEPVKVYHSLCGWALHLFGDLTGERRYREAAVRAVEAALAEQQENGWISRNCLSRPQAPLTHTIGYTLQALLEVGVLANRPDFVTAARRGIDAIVPLVDRRGFLAGRFYDDWKPALFSSCLTGAAQLAVIMYRLSAVGEDTHYRAVADRIVNFLKALQQTGSADPGVNGALAGSFPIFGEYMTWGYPNWATKYLLDALMLQHSVAGVEAR